MVGVLEQCWGWDTQGRGHLGQGTPGAGDTGQLLALARAGAPRAEGFDYPHMCRAAGL